MNESLTCNTSALSCTKNSSAETKTGTIAASPLGIMACTEPSPGTSAVTIPEVSPTVAMSGRIDFQTALSRPTMLPSALTPKATARAFSPGRA